MNWRCRRSGSERVFRALLWLYPPSLRRAYGDDMAQLFRDTLRDEIAHAGMRGMRRAWGHALTDLMVTIPREWPREMRWIVRLRHSLTPIRIAFTRYPPHTSLSGSVVYGSRTGSRRSMNDKFGKFTERARKVLSLAQEEAQRFNHNYIGTEHLLLGLVREGDGVAAVVLTELGVELNKVRSAAEFIIGRGDRLVLGEVGLTPRSKKVIELAVDEARRLNHHYVGTEHLLLGLVREGEGIAAGVLQSLGVNLEKVRAETLQVLNQGGAGAARSRTTARPSHSANLGKFSGRGRRVIAVALTEARDRGHPTAGTGHALLALLDEHDGLATWALGEAGIDTEDMRRELEIDLGPRAQPEGQHAHSPVSLDEHLLRAIVLAANEAVEMWNAFVGPEELLLGIISANAGLGGQILAERAADLDQMRDLSILWPARSLNKIESRPTLGRLTLLCYDVTATARFYMDQLGATSISQESTAGKVNLRLPGGGPPLALRETHPDAPLQNGVVLDIWVGNLDLAWKTFHDANTADLTPISENADGRHFTIHDPDGRMVRIFEASAQGGEQPSE